MPHLLFWVTLKCNKKRVGNWYCWLRVLLLGRNPEEGWQEELDRNANGIQYSPRTQDIASGFFSSAFQKWKLSRKSIKKSGTFLSSKDLNLWEFNRKTKEFESTSYLLGSIQTLKNVRIEKYANLYNVSLPSKHKNEPHFLLCPSASPLYNI